MNLKKENLIKEMAQDFGTHIDIKDLEEMDWMIFWVGEKCENKETKLFVEKVREQIQNSINILTQA